MLPNACAEQYRMELMERQKREWKTYLDKYATHSLEWGTDPGSPPTIKEKVLLLCN
jgi:hypothetical protein